MRDVKSKRLNQPRRGKLMASARRQWEEKWKFIEPLGKGGQGVTSLVTSADGSVPKAVLKKLKNRNDAQSRGRMFREVGNQRVLHNVGCAVPQVLDDNVGSFEEEGTELFVVMEYISGKTLAQLVKDQGPLSLEVAVGLVAKIADIVNVAHAQGILHRDLKPDNVMVRDLQKHDVVVIDYGLSFNDEDEDLTRMSETIRNKFLDLPENNTPGGSRRDSRSDVTALCGILYFCLTGHTPGHLQSSDGRLPHMRPGFSIRERIGNDPRLRQLETFFDCGFSPTIEYRFQNIQEFLSRLRQSAESGAGTGVADPVEIARRASDRLRRGDRKTQLQEFAASGKQVVAAIDKYVQSIHNKLGRFHLTTTSANNIPRPPAGFDWVPNVGTLCQLNAAHHNTLHQRHYRVASRGEQCVLLCMDLFRPGDSGAPQATGDWKEVYWFGGTGEPDTATAQVDVQDWVGKSIEDLSVRLAP
jgi:serine/threonine protein kinase